MDRLKGFTYIFEDKNWFGKMFVGSLITAVPFPIVPLEDVKLYPEIVSQTVAPDSAKFRIKLKKSRRRNRQRAGFCR